MKKKKKQKQIPLQKREPRGQINKYNMILMHDIKPYTRDALKRIIKYGKNNGYTFSKITANTPIVSQHVNN